MITSSPLKKALCLAGVIGAVHIPYVYAQSMVDLGTLGGTNSYARGVSADGNVIVGYSRITGDSAFHAFKYTGSTMSDLGTLGGTRSYARGVSADGKVIVGESHITGDTAYHAFKYTGSTMSDLGTLGGLNSYATGVSADGNVIVGYSRMALSGTQAFKYTGSTMTSLGTLGGSNSYARGVSANGNVIVGESQTTDNAAEHAFKYSGGTISGLGTLGGTNSYARGVSADGNVIVGYSRITGDSAFHAFKYTGSTMSDLGTLGGINSFAHAISADGNVIVGSSSITGSSAVHAFKYTGSTMSDLGTLGGTSSYAYGVSADGKVIVGNSQITGDSTYHSFVYGAWANGGLVDVQNTYSALASNSYQLNSLLNTQNTLLAVSLNSDCTVYGANNVCVGVGGRYTTINSPSSSQAAGNIQVGYRFDPTLRVGIFLDQGISNRTPNNYTVKNSSPLAGFFAVYAPTGTNLGLQVKASGAYSNNVVNIARTTLANTEAGQGSSTMTTQGAQLESAYGFAVGDGWVASPIVGIKATKVSRNGYAETAGATFPITFNTVNQSATTAYAGAKVFGYVTPNVSVGASAGVEQDVTSSMSNYSGSIYYLGDFSMTAPAILHTRAFVGANTDYWIEKNRRVSLGVYYNQQSLNTANGVTAMLNYTIGL